MQYMAIWGGVEMWNRGNVELWKRRTVILNFG